VLKKDINIGFKANYFKKLAELESGNFWFRARIRLILFALNQHCPSLKSFLEIGCGTGFVISAISQQFPEAKLLGSEYFEEGLVFARKRLVNVNFTQMDARYIPYKLKLDAIGAFDVLEHIEEDDVVLEQIYKALKPGGVAFLTVPQHRWLWSVVDDHACHVRRYNVNELHEKVCRAGFNIIRSTSFVSTLLPLMYLSRILKRNKVNDDMAELRINPVLNKIFERFLDFELLLIRFGFSLPFGGSRFLVALKPITNKDAFR